MKPPKIQVLIPLNSNFLTKQGIIEFADIIPNELPSELPPLRDMQHLVPGSQLLNLPHYRLNPPERAKLNRHVQKLLSKDFVHHNMSPCTVPPYSEKR